jgi:hypothetical protein
MKYNLVTPLTLILLACLSCTPLTFDSAQNSRRSIEVTTNNNENPPPSLNDLNYLQSQGVVTTSTLTLPGNFSDTLYLRGEAVNQWLSGDVNNRNTLCLVAYFPTSSDNQLLLVTATPRSVLDFNTNTTEWYFILNSENAGLNSGSCSDSGLTSALTPLVLI